MLPAGIISSCDGVLAEVAAAFGSSDVAAGTVGATGAGRFGIAGMVIGLLVAAGLKRRGIWRTVGIGCAQRSRPVKNRIRASVVVFMVPLRLRVSNCRRSHFSGSWRRAGCWR